MPARVTYWTGLWQPRREALSHEVASLRSALAPRAFVVSLADGQRFGWFPGARVLRLSTKHYALFRLVALGLQQRRGMAHVVGAVNAWHQLRAVRRPPILFTVALAGPVLASRFYEAVTHFAPETRSLADLLMRAGVPAERITVVPPGVDLGRFHPSPMPAGPPWRLIFASTPSNPAELEPRGIPLLVDLCRRRPDVEVFIPWRQWGDLGRAHESIRALLPPPNFRVEMGDVADISSLYRAAHAVVCAFDDGAGKAAPNFVLESLASGRPALVTTGCQLAEDVALAGAGVCCERSADALAASVDDLLARLPEASVAARRLAEARFGRLQWLESYRELYARVDVSGGSARS